MIALFHDRSRAVMSGLFAIGCAVVSSGVSSDALAQAGGGVAWNGSTWRVEDIQGRSAPDNVQTTLSVAADGAAAGSTGCNRFRGQAVVDGAALRFGPLATTRRACAPAVADQEKKFLRALERVRFARFDGSRLLLLSKSGAILLTLTRK